MAQPDNEAAQPAPAVWIVTVTKGWDWVRWLCERHIAEMEADGWKAKQKAPPHPLPHCEMCREEESTCE